MAPLLTLALLALGIDPASHLAQPGETATAAVPLPPPLPHHGVPRRLAAVMAANDGRSAAQAYKVSSIDDEYAIIRALDLKAQEQALIRLNDKTYDRIAVLDPRSGQTWALWFDISDFFGHEFGL